MKRILTLSTLLLFFAIGFTSCEKFAEDTPQAIKKLIKEWNKSEKHLSLVTEYQCEEIIIYCFSELEKVGRCFYFNSHLYDKAGNLLCSAYPRLQDKACLIEYGDCFETRIIWEKVVSI